MPKTKPSAAQFSMQVDEQIANAEAHAKPILEHLRQLVHKAVPEVNEAVKWSRPFFTLNGENLCFMAAFKTYCAFGFWSPRMPEYLEAQGMPKVEGAGSIGRIASLEDVPNNLPQFVRHAAELIRSGEAGSAMDGRTRKGTRQALEIPQAFDHALRTETAAKAFFDGLPPSCKREYVEWVASARKDETRDRRIAQAVTMLAQQRRFHDKYRK